MIHPCDKLCGNKTASGYCATTTCINPQYSNLGTAQYGQGVQKCIITNADKIRSMTDEELAEFVAGTDFCELLCNDTPVCIDGQCFARLFKWLQQEAKDA